MLILKRRAEFWFAILALHKIGAVAIPATHLLTTKDIVYRNNAADVKMIVAVDDRRVMEHVDEAEPDVADAQAQGRRRRAARRAGSISARSARRPRPSSRARPAPTATDERRHASSLLHLRHDRHAQDGARTTSPTRSATS